MPSPIRIWLANYNEVPALLLPARFPFCDIVLTLYRSVSSTGYGGFILRYAVSPSPSQPSVSLNQEKKERRENGNKAYARTSSATPASLRSAPRGTASPGTRVVFQELHREHCRRLDAHRGARNGSGSVLDDGAELLGASLRAP